MFLVASSALGILIWASLALHLSLFYSSSFCSIIFAICSSIFLMSSFLCSLVALSSSWSLRMWHLKYSDLEFRIAPSPLLLRIFTASPTWRSRAVLEDPHNKVWRVLPIMHQNLVFQHVVVFVVSPVSSPVFFAPLSHSYLSLQHILMGAPCPLF